MTFDEAKTLIRAKYTTVSFGIHCELWSTAITPGITHFTISIPDFPREHDPLPFDGQQNRHKHFQALCLEQAVEDCLRGGVRTQKADDAVPVGKP